MQQPPVGAVRDAQVGTSGDSTCIGKRLLISSRHVQALAASRCGGNYAIKFARSCHPNFVSTFWTPFVCFLRNLCGPGICSAGIGWHPFARQRQSRRCPSRHAIKWYTCCAQLLARAWCPWCTSELAARFYPRLQANEYRPFIYRHLLAGIRECHRYSLICQHPCMCACMWAGDVRGVW